MIQPTPPPSSQATSAPAAPASAREPGSARKAGAKLRQRRVEPGAHPTRVLDQRDVAGRAREEPRTERRREREHRGSGRQDPAARGGRSVGVAGEGRPHRGEDLPVLGDRRAHQPVFERAEAREATRSGTRPV